MSMTPTAALRRIADAIEADELSEDTRVELHGNVVTATLPRYFYRHDLARDEAALTAFAEIFPDGKRRRLHTLHRGDKRTPAIDRADYRARVDGTLIVLEYAVKHQHDDFRGEIHNGEPRWRCTGCRKPITITESRRLGLLPKLK